ncbi:hypothetical protein PENTCL1PPCAC_18826, partial [Pristionchus entomophagus]
SGIYHFTLAFSLVKYYFSDDFRFIKRAQMGILLLSDVIVLLFLLSGISLASAAPPDLTKPLWAQQTDRSLKSELNSKNDQLSFFDQRKTPQCFPKEQPQCVTTVFYYFECCADDCCMRLQPITFVVFVSIIVLILTCIVVGFVRKCRASPKHKYHYAVKN